MHASPPAAQELELLTEGAAVYKLLGPMLIKQDEHEAKQNVQKRLEFIRGELCVARCCCC